MRNIRLSFIISIPISPSICFVLCAPLVRGTQLIRMHSTHVRRHGFRSTDIGFRPKEGKPLWRQDGSSLSRHDGSPRHE